MANLNKVLLIGRLTRDPELRYIPSGAAVAEFGFAVNRYYTSGGERKEDTCFLEVSAWGKLGETVQNYLKKGRQVFVEGHLTYSEWQTQEGQKRSRIRVVADNIQFLDGGRADAGARQSGPSEFSQERPLERPQPGPQESGGFAGAADDECPF
jgi:single-strand DNA-binding protein